MAKKMVIKTQRDFSAPLASYTFDTLLSRSRNEEQGINTKNGNVYLPREVKEVNRKIRQQLAEQLLLDKENPLIKGPFEIECVLRFKTYSSDMDNRIKTYMDVLTYAGVIEDDRHCHRMVLNKSYCEKGEEERIFVTITELDFSQYPHNRGMTIKAKPV